MALPLSRDVTFAAGSQVPSATMNNLQDGIIGKYHGSVKRPLHAGMYYEGDAEYSAYISIGFVNPLNGEGRFFLPIDIPNGSRITAIHAFMRSGGTEDCDWALYTAAPSGGATSVSAIDEATESLGTNWSEYTITLTTPEVVTDGTRYAIRWVTNPTTDQVNIGHAAVTYDKSA